MAADRFTVVVAVSNPATVEQLLRTAADVTCHRNGRIHAVTVVDRAAPTPPLLFSESSIRQTPGNYHSQWLESAIESIEQPVTTAFVSGSSLSQGIRDAVADVDGDLLLLGWQDRPDVTDVVLGETVDPVIRRPPCDILVERVGKMASAVETVLVPTVGSPNLPLVTSVAEAIAVANDARVVVLSVVQAEADQAARERAEETLGQATERFDDLAVTQSLVEAPDPQTGIVEMAAGADVLVMGGTGTGRFRPPVVGSVARAVGQSAPCPAIIAKRRPDSAVERLLGRF